MHRLAVIAVLSVLWVHAFSLPMLTDQMKNSVEELKPTALKFANSLARWIAPNFVKFSDALPNKTRIIEKLQILRTNHTQVSLEQAGGPNDGINAIANITNVTMNGTWNVGYGWLKTGGILKADFNNLSIEAILQVSMAAGSAALAVQHCKATLGKPKLQFSDSWMSSVINQFVGYVEDYMHDTMGQFVCDILRAAANVPMPMG